ncbi:C40 family peptidase [Aliiroseovarius sp. F20344]|uniref:C40 family peptidase n=1 Tax=Aliiroseovarius sp. F20344 TaxID=2926414 RepID=UPI001FF2277A|nr:C40 family peptidase [Aliiroseovarius sp. F20344]MCK0140894.1 C40 family peptidase [Aliiroseovarius sp. F20344]
MMDRRLTPANENVAHESLRGKVNAQRFTEGTLKQVVGDSFLLDAPSGNRDRQVLSGDQFNILDGDDHMVFGQSLKDGYVGYLEAWGLGDPQTLTHRVTHRTTHMYPEPNFKSPHNSVFHMNSQVQVVATEGKWAEVKLPKTPMSAPKHGYIPMPHLCPIDEYSSDPVTIAEQFLDTPYVWAGNSGFGIDCSGLVQAALLACGIGCPADSDLQEAALGQEIPEGAPLQRGDLLFWKGHVAMVVDDTRMIHANAHDMSVVYEDMASAITRIEAQGDGPVTSRKRL